MNWGLINLTPEQELAIYRYGYVGAFYKVLMPRLLSMEPRKTDPVTPTSPDTDVHPLNTYVPLAHQR
jgi:hypothetical protein